MNTVLNLWVNDMCTNNPRYDFTCYRCIFNGAVHHDHQRSAKEVWLTVFPCLLTALIRIPLNVMFERAQVWFLLFTYPREHAWLQFSLFKMKKNLQHFFSLLYATQGLDCRIVEFFIIYYMFPKTKMI